MVSKVGTLKVGTLKQGWLIGELKEKVGLSTQTLRYYERIGLLQPPKRTESGYRLYSQDAIDQLTFVQRAKQFGLSLEEIKQLIDLKAGTIAPYGTFKSMVKKHLSDLDQHLQDLRQAKQLLTRRYEQIANLLPDDDELCIENETACKHHLFDLIVEFGETILGDAIADSPAKGADLLRLYMDGERDFRLQDLIGTSLIGANLSGADFSQAKLMLANLNEVSLEKSKLIGTNLTGADLAGAYLREARLIGALLMGVDLSEADLSKANLVAANLGGANLSQAKLHATNLSEAILSGADLRGADLSGVTLWGANLCGANLQDAILPTQELSGVNLQGAVLPNGKVWQN